MTEIEQAPLTLDDMLAGSGASYRQLDHWVRSGYLNPERRPGKDEDVERGSGYERLWSVRDLRVATIMVRLTKIGLLAHVAADWAAAAVDHGVHTVDAEGVSLIWQTTEEAP